MNRRADDAYNEDRQLYLYKDRVDGAEYVYDGMLAHSSNVQFDHQHQ